MAISEPYRGPGDYESFNLIGSEKIPISNHKTPENFSFSKQPRNMTKANFTINSTRQSRDMSHPLASHLTSIHYQKETPGVGDYMFDSIELKQREPRATIGKSERWNSKDSSLR